MLYVFDTNSLRIIEYYYPERFPSFWNDFNENVTAGKILSVKEVYNELEGQLKEDFMIEWMTENKKIFMKPGQDEMNIVSRIFRRNTFQGLVKGQNLLQGMPVADPFVVALAKIKNGIVVTEEKYKRNAASIPNVCEYLNVRCTKMNGFMQSEKMIY